MFLCLSVEKNEDSLDAYRKKGCASVRKIERVLQKKIVKIKIIDTSAVAENWKRLLNFCF